MLTYDELKTNARKFVSLTSLTPEEFNLLLPAFERAYLKKYPGSKTKTGKARKRKVGAGRKGSLASIEQKLLFALVYQKSYPLQVVMGELFGIGQSQANEWIHDLLPILKQALDDLGFLPERDPQKFKQTEKDRKDAADSIIDGTERRRQRPKKAEKQALHYSGKKKIHSDKNIVIATVKRKRVSYLSQTYPGKTHDKKVADTENISYPKHIALHKDTGFQGYEPNVRKLYQPKKSRTRKN
ncbi:MAG TPA: transposase family protein [Anaerolineales bacterium]|nr:transposase family protein [Anaerolineales bacterium]